MASLKRKKKEGKPKPKIKKKRRSLAEMSAEEFMASVLSGSEEEEEEGGSGRGLETAPAPTERPQSSTHQSETTSSTRLKTQLSNLATTDPAFYRFLQGNDSHLLQFSDSEEEREEGWVGQEGGGEGRGSSDDDDEMGEPEPVPPHITSRAEIVHSDSEDMESEGEGREREEEEEGAYKGIPVTLTMVQKWVDKITTAHYIPALHNLTLALHAAVAGILNRTRRGVREGEEEEEVMVYRVEGTPVFNAVVVACLKHVSTCLSHHTPPQQHGRRPQLPSSHKGWSKVRRTVKPYLSDLLRLSQGVREPSMQCAVLRHMQDIVLYFASYPKLQRELSSTLISLWAGGEQSVQVLAFLILRRITLVHPHPSLHRTLKKLYLTFVRNCKFTTPKSLPQIHFMQNCLVELLAVDPPTTYQHAFVYIRQLAVHLRTALTSNKKDAQQTVYNWQYVHCLDLWTRVLGEVHHDALRPLVYPLVQTTLGALQLQPTARYYPLRLHCVETLLNLIASTGTYIPLPPYLLEVLEAQSSKVSAHPQTGKPPDLTCLLKATKQQLQSRGFQSAILNKSFELLLQFFASHTHHIGFPELAFPILVRLRKVAKTTPLSWLRMQLKQLIEKVEEVSREVERERSSVSFAPKDAQLIAAWERERRGLENPVSRFLATWCKVHQQMSQQAPRQPTSQQQAAQEKGGRKKARRKRVGTNKKKVSSAQALDKREEEVEGGGVEGGGVRDDEADIVEAFEFSSDESGPEIN